MLVLFEPVRKNENDIKTKRSIKEHHVGRNGINDDVVDDDDYVISQPHYPPY